MYLILEKDAALKRNSEEVIKRGWKPPVLYWWAMTELPDGRIAMNVKDGDGLTDAEMTECVDALTLNDRN
jgi:hypothetical protein